ncbi:MAG: hypothetical protein ACRELB_24195 [Polyangiaceae bacterium]
MAAVLAGAMGCGGNAFTTIPDAEAPDATPGDDEGGLPVDATLDAPRTDAPADGVPDGDRHDDAGSDAGTAAPDAGSEAGSDAMPADASAVEASLPDARDDATPDATTDATPGESGLDGETDSGTDASADSATDAACTPALFFLDGDGDGYGGTSTSTACAPPDSGAWVTVGGDCDDSNITVNPGQKAYFAAGYTPTGKTTVSFDYDCSGQETESGAPARASCGFVGLTCTGSGYLEASPVRSGAGVDPYCGSAEAVVCAVSNLVCQAGSPQPSSPIACH